MDAEQPNEGRGSNRKRWALVLTALAAGAFLAGVAGAQFFGRTSTKVPESIAKRVDFPIYIPSRLPGSFKILENSFSFQDHALIFTAKDSSGASITFAEQKRQPGFDFTSFYNNQLKDAATLSSTPFPSVTGRAKSGQAKIVSVVADKTWIFVSTPAPLNQHDMQTIAANLKVYQ